jgi:hypothetical protein
MNVNVADSVSSSKTSSEGKTVDTVSETPINHATIYGTSNSSSGDKNGEIIGGCIGSVLVVAGAVFGYQKYRNRMGDSVNAKTLWENFNKCSTEYSN